MYIVKMQAHKNNSRKAQRMVSIDKYNTIEDAQAFIAKKIDEQYGMCMKAWGLTALDTAESDDKMSITALYRSACTIFSCTALKLDFQICDVR